jgi:hypothetical protein
VEIHEECMTLLHDFSMWRTRRVCLDEDFKETRVIIADEEKMFLGHPPLVEANPFYAYLLNEYRCAVLFVTFIASPFIGRASPYDDLRKIHAIDSCRSLSAMGEDSFPVPLVRILQLPGLVFANSMEYPEECAWIVGQLDRVSERGVIGAMKVKEMLKVVWGSGQSWTYEATERLMQNADVVERFELEEIYDHEM